MSRCGWKTMATKLLLVCAFLVQAQEIVTLTFKDSPADNTVLSTLAADTVLHCSAVSPLPPFIIAWKHNGAYVNASTRASASYNQTTGQSAYTISGGVTYFDAGTYQCAALNGLGNVLALSAIGTLTVVGPPLFLTALSVLVVPLGGYAIFAAPSVISNPPYSSVAWYNGTAALQSGGRVGIAPSALTISNVQATDAGTYEYTVTNSYGTSNIYGSLSIGSPLDTQVHIQVGLNGSNTSYTLLKEGDQLILQCSYAQGSNVHEVTWSKDMVTLNSHLTVGSNEITFAISAVNRSDAGLYVCAAQNQQGGTTQASIVVDIQYRPYFTVVPANRTVNYSTILQNMQCQASSNPGPPTITWRAPSGQPLLVSNGAPVLGPLQGRDSGKYTCVATNVLGVSTAEVSVTVLDVPVVTISPPYLAVLQGTDVFLTCMASGSPPVMLITWKDSTNKILRDDSELFLPSVLSDASGQYSCTAVNSYGNQTAYVSLTVLLAQPIITVLPVLTAVLIGQSFTLTCSPSLPVPGSTITWLRNGTPVPTLDTPAVTSGNLLTIPSARMVHNGVYTCRVSLGQLLFIGSGIVIAGVAPTALTPSTTVRKQPGNRAVLPCNATGFPAPSIQWSKLSELGQSQYLSLVGETFRVDSEGLLFTSVHREDSGWYTGWIQNIFGVAQCICRLQVAGAPLVYSISPSTLIAAHNFSLTCAVAYNYPQVTVKWTRKNNVSIPTDRAVQNGTSLIISPVEPSDEGYYQCYVSNAYGSASLDQFITVLVLPTVTVPASPDIIILDSDAQLLCVGAGKPLPTVQWVLAPPPSRTAISGVGPNQTLVIHNVTYEDEGTTYACNVSNELKSTVGKVTVSVRGAPPTNMLADVTTSRYTVVSWELPTYSKDLVNYQLFYRAIGSPIQTVIYNLSTNVSNYYISELHPAITYAISVQGMYKNDVQGLHAELLVTTLEEGKTVELNDTATNIVLGCPPNQNCMAAPSSPPNILKVAPGVEALSIFWEPPLPTDQNGVIIQYNIYYGLTPTDKSATSSFDHVIYYFPIDVKASAFNYTLVHLEGGVSYDIMLSAATSVGSGPNSSIATAVTIKDLQIIIILATTIPGGSIIFGVLLLLCCGICIWCRRLVKSRRSPTTLDVEKSGHLDDGGLWSKKKKKREVADSVEDSKMKKVKFGRKRGQIEISGPLPGIPVNAKEIGPNKLTVMSKEGVVLSWHPHMVTKDQIAPPPPPGGTVMKVKNKSLPSTYRETKSDDSNSETDSFDQSPPNMQQQQQSRYSGIYAEPDINPRHGGVTVRPLKPAAYHLEPAINPYAAQSMKHEAKQKSSHGSSNMRATKNSTNLTLGQSQDNLDSSNAVYASVPAEHISMKRLRRESQHKKGEQGPEPSGGGASLGDGDPVQEDEIEYGEGSGSSEGEGASYTLSLGEDGGFGFGQDIPRTNHQELLVGDASQTKAEKKKQQKERERALEERRKEDARKRNERQKILAEVRNLSEKERKRQEKEKRAGKMARDLDVMPTPHFDVNARSRALFENAAASIF